MNQKNFDFREAERLFVDHEPDEAVEILARKMGVKNIIFKELHHAFFEVKRVDIFPCNGGSRGFILVLDRETALFFYQKGDHFIYDGFEIGPYAKGDVTIFDQVVSKKHFTDI
jgi:hypothetical protein